MNNKDIARLIKERRLILNLQQKDLAELSKVSLRSIIQIENAAGNPSLATLSKLANLLGLEIKLVVKDKP
jgi:transcriptional regulator with XRE-family HTH domain